MGEWDDWSLLKLNVQNLEKKKKLFDTDIGNINIGEKKPFKNIYIFI